jgi:hypothetical protein
LIVAVSMRALPALAVVLLVSIFVLADDASNKADAKAGAGAAAKAGPTSPDQSPDPSAEPAAGRKSARNAARPDAKAEARALRLTRPWKDLSSLSEDQKRQINQIHRKALADINAVEQRERDDIMALLNDQQKAELNALVEKEAAERKARAAQRKAQNKVSQKDGSTDDAEAASDEAEAEAEEEEEEPAVGAK